MFNGRGVRALPTTQPLDWREGLSHASYGHGSLGFACGSFGFSINYSTKATSIELWDCEATKRPLSEFGEMVEKWLSKHSAKVVK